MPITRQILLIRDKQVLLDRDLATLYGVETRAINQAVKRNQERFPERNCFQLNSEEFEKWKSQLWYPIRRKWVWEKSPMHSQNKELQCLHLFCAAIPPFEFPSKLWTLLSKCDTHWCKSAKEIRGKATITRVLSNRTVKEYLTGKNFISYFPWINLPSWFLAVQRCC